MRPLHRHSLAAILVMIVLMACGSQRDSAGSPQGAKAGITLDPTKVPEDLRPLLPVIQEWGIGDDVDRGHKVDAATPEARQRLRDALTPHQDRITAWLNSFGQQLMPDEAAAFMYAQLALEEIDASEGN